MVMRSREIPEALVPKSEVSIAVEVEGDRVALSDPGGSGIAETSPPPVPKPEGFEDPVHLPLEALAWGRSGDKGNKANIGIIARRPEFVPFIAAQVTEGRVTELFCHFLAVGQERPVERFYMPGPGAFNFLLHDVLGGGGIASLRADPQGKGYAQVLLAESVQVPRALADQYQLEIL